MVLNETDLLVLRALQQATTECHHSKSVVTLRYALLEAQAWNADIEFALCNSGDEHPTVQRYYSALCKLVNHTQFAEGAGDLRLPAGPRYTECWITQAGKEFLDQS